MSTRPLLGRFKRIGTLALAAALGLTTALPARADQPSEGVEQAPFKNPDGSFCVVHMVKKTEPKLSTKPVCYDTATEALKDASGGAITDVPADGKGLGSPEFVAKIKAHNDSVARIRATGARAEYIIGAVFQLEWYEGESLFISGPTTCPVGDVYYDTDFTGTWWDNRTSSAQSYYQCYGLLWQFTFSGQYYHVQGSTPLLGDFDNRTSSVEFY
ncbi:hypothetical protein GBF35_16280 [Nonomuraea phyllanthi]|uniref:hypothetical protein n=1 Tax=Nonomuraea phyllanthi TaxID=2219224 RepID=UPI001292E808|nr:hypothetical protein [Nonomuraea phyllanthi]QFY08028.1 hypothetical protein GBF35_16280 [Nonomuraea phyllanthi]